MNTIGFYLDEYGRSADFVCFKACFADLQHVNITRNNHHDDVLPFAGQNANPTFKTY
ncbi:MAG: hypothetical protein HOO86_08710 [Bacteroidales bacterium]|nr:hypothetical protein [Bacteroidales bacterium]